jgi:hypothetical protein
VDELDKTKQMTGRKTETLVVGGGEVELTLRPLTIAQCMDVSEMEFQNGYAETLHETHLAAVRCGYTGTKEDLSHIIEGDEIIAAEEALHKLSPLLMGRARAMALAIAGVMPVPPTDSLPEGSGE